jgi:hypothetical protein
MGDRVSIQFANGKGKSVVLFSHWGGKGFVARANRYVKQLKARSNGKFQPLDQLEPQTVMVDFIREITDGMERVESDLYLGATDNDGDNSDNGHFVIKLG